MQEDVVFELMNLTVRGEIVLLPHPLVVVSGTGLASMAAIGAIWNWLPRIQLARLSARVTLIASLVVAMAMAGLPASGAQMALSQGEAGHRIAFSSVRCGHNGLRQTNSLVQVIVVAFSGNPDCNIHITEALIRASDFHAGYACSSVERARNAYVVGKDDWRVTREPGYAKQLAIAEAFAGRYHLQLEVVYIKTFAGTHKEPRCRKMLLGQ